MQRILGLLTLAIVLIPTSVQAAEPATLQIGMLQGMFRDIQPAVVQAMSRPLQELILRQTGLSGDVHILPDAYSLADQLKSNRLQLGVFHGFEFAWLKERHPNLVPMIVSIPPGRKLQACVVVQKDSKAKSLADLLDEQVLIPRASKAHCHIYIERKRLGLPANCAMPKTKPALTAEEAIDAVVLGDAAAALVDHTALTGYNSLQPGAFKQLRILCESEEFPFTVLAYNKDAANQPQIERVRQLLTNAHKMPAGKPLMMLWNLQGFEEVPNGYSTHLEQILKCYPPPETTTKISTTVIDSPARK